MMYRFPLAQLSPLPVEAIAAQLYVEMLKGGYTSVAEFHYLHNDPAGRPYLNRAEMAERVVAAAYDAGIRLTLLPVLYQTGNFGKPASESQRRFLFSTDDYNELVYTLHGQYRTSSDVRVGVAPHSLRAVTPEALQHAITTAHILSAGGFSEAPIHIHVAEQIKEVEDCLAAMGKRPVEWLLDEQHRWELDFIHCTHMDAGTNGA